ncbi:hypothetical protein EGW08_014452 [Elysia chlorotica]|uniref:tRNA (uracil(54)-C(5))-methyltransferase n=1 Tax=Elysia chlorotica TaxID=188477 RepID=A0A433T8C4_ELYCH|nr:hypothetical protein EGW08_014452 [Elysia chlorotica]
MSQDSGCVTKSSDLEDSPSDAKKLKLSDEDAAEVTNGAASSADAKEENDIAEADPLSYTRGAEFTSEIFKIQIHNLPRFGFGDLKKRLKMLGLKPNKIKSPDRQSVCYICFRNEEERDNALKKLNGHLWKNHKLEAKIAAPIADPYLQKQRQHKDHGSSIIPTEKMKEMSAEEAEERLKENVCPLWNMSYSEQLQQKTDKVKAVLRKVARDDFVHVQFRNIKTQFEGMACELLPIIPSPETSEYRNKNEFTVGYGLDGKTVVVGFRYGLYKEGITAVGGASNLGLAMPKAIPVIKSFTEFVSRSKWTPYLQHAGTGHWQTLTVRTFRTGDVMAMIDFVPRDLDPSEIEEARASVKAFYTEGEQKDVDIKSFYFRVFSKKGSNSSPDVQLLFGEKHVFETLMGMSFRISPEAFFQVNTPATEKLYGLISSWCNASTNTTVLDICCGTGTIGLSMAKNVKEVIGIEMCAQAVEDAKENAAINGVKNVKYYSKKVEEVIQPILSSLNSSNLQDLVAVVDPPRAGLHKDVIRTLRKCEHIERLVYVSCNPEIAQTNFVDLIRPETVRLKGSPFTLEKAVPVDLFPGTKHCELVLLFTRGNQRSSCVTATADQKSYTYKLVTDKTEVQTSSEDNVEGQKQSHDIEDKKMDKDVENQGVPENTIETGGDEHGSSDSQTAAGEKDQVPSCGDGTNGSEVPLEKT